MACGGGSGIRTHGELAPTPVFKTGALNRSAIPPVTAGHCSSVPGKGLSTGLREAALLQAPGQDKQRHNLARFRPQSVNTVINNSCAQRIGVRDVVGIVE